MGDKEFFKEIKDSFRIVCYFFCDSIFCCKIVDKYLVFLVLKYIEVKFVKVDVEWCYFFVERLNVKVLLIILFIKDGKFFDCIVGFDELGGYDEFSIVMMEWRIVCFGVINYFGDLSVLFD